MRIFFCSHGLRTAAGTKSLWAINLLDPLREMGHEVVESSLDWDTALDFAADEGWIRKHRPGASERLLAEVRAAHASKPLNLFFSYFYNSHVEPSAIAAIRKMGIPAINFYCNAAHQFHLVREIAPSYDFCWVPERQALAAYKAVGAKPLHVQMGAHPGYYRPQPSARDIELCFVGSIYADRVQWLGRIADAGLGLRVFSGRAAPISRGRNGGGRSFAREALHDLFAAGPVYLARRAWRYGTAAGAYKKIAGLRQPFAEDLVSVFHRSHAVLNLSHVYDGGKPGGKLKSHVRLRDFEAPMSRALYVPQWCDELDEYFDPEREVLAWRSVEELRAKLGKARRDKGWAESVREAGYRRSLAEHTSSHRFRQLFQLAGLR